MSKNTLKKNTSKTLYLEANFLCVDLGGFIDLGGFFLKGVSIK